MSKFKPQLAPNELLTVGAANKLSAEEYFLQPKVDGIRGVVIDGVIKTRSLKELGNKALPERMKGLCEASTAYGYYIDGEFDSASTSFNDLSGILRSFDKPLPDDLVFKIFDIYDPERPDIPAIDRWTIANQSAIPNCDVIQNIPWPEDFADGFQEALDLGYEGLMVKRKDAKYKCGRGTYKQGIIYKMKPYETFDCVVTGFEQATVVREGAEKKVNELGRSETSRKKGDRVPIDAVAAIWVDFEGIALKVSVASLTHPERALLWEEKDKYLGKYVEFKGMMLGAKDLPRHPMFIRWRADKDA